MLHKLYINVGSDTFPMRTIILNIITLYINIMSAMVLRRNKKLYMLESGLNEDVMSKIIEWAEFNDRQSTILYHIYVKRRFNLMRELSHVLARMLVTDAKDLVPLERVPEWKPMSRHDFFSNFL